MTKNQVRLLRSKNSSKPTKSENYFNLAKQLA